MKTNDLTYLAMLISAMAATTPASFAQADAAATQTPAVEESKAADKDKEKKVETGTLADLIADSATFSILTKAIKAAGLEETLGSKGTYTIFAPTDEAFGKLPDGTLDKLLLPANKEKLRSLLLYHVIPGNVLSIDLKDGQVTTANAEKVTIDVDGDTIKVGESKVYSVDVMASNGVMHSVGEVIVPKSLDGFAKLEKE
ncbi:MAG: fasciclin domain-containing protein [Verrucomicrobiaceae bacterium]|nr:MAG: fasciclin domain-containing protein [Verrucomicrobiaceae bacterium]